ncbi:hypothetical protein MMC31_007592, partial [Peltigera leucophlebia]|nr:hypothetical protein [Peltigera leucophlebia]
MLDADIGITRENLALIAKAVQAILQQAPPLTGSSGFIRSAGPPKTGTAQLHHNLKFNAAKLGFFDPNFDGKFVETSSDIEHILRDTYFRD